MARFGIVGRGRNEVQDDRVQGDDADGDGEDPEARHIGQFLDERNMGHSQGQNSQAVRGD